ncbi:MAG: hypothetical protein LBD16_02645 [Oscillospiraceae bacterium]|nr:hypothetical protein [Oscillospiraceae bacterium]
MKNCLSGFMFATIILLFCPSGVLSEEVYPPEISEDIIIQFPDANFEAAVRKAVGKSKGVIRTSDAASVTRLRVSGPGIKDLTGILNYRCFSAIITYSLMILLLL